MWVYETAKRLHHFKRSQDFRVDHFWSHVLVLTLLVDVLNHWCLLVFSWCSLFLGICLFGFHETAEDTDLVILVLLEIETILLSESKLEQVVIEGLLRDIDFGCCIFEGVANKISISKNSIVQFSPKTDFLDDLLYRTFFGPFGFTAW